MGMTFGTGISLAFKTQVDWQLYMYPVPMDWVALSHDFTSFSFLLGSRNVSLTDFFGLFLNRDPN